MKACNQVKYVVCGLMVLGTVVARAGTVNWTATGAALTLEDGSTLDPAGSLIILGTFNGITDAGIQAAASDPVTLFSSNFSQIDSSLVGTGAGGFNGVWADSVNGDFTTTLASFAGQSIYLWTFNEPTIAGATEEGIFKFAATFPNDSPNPGTVDVDLGDLAASGTILVGGQNLGPILTDIGELPSSFHMGCIPEPSTFLLVLGSLLLAANMRPRSAR